MKLINSSSRLQKLIIDNYGPSVVYFYPQYTHIEDELIVTDLICLNKYNKRIRTLKDIQDEILNLSERDFNE
jgi:hypothetical protein